jgi:hypothetical protein
VGLFDVPLASPLDATALPLDAMAYGAAGALKGADGKPLAPIAGVAEGASLERTDKWQAQANRSPGICRVVNAN